MLVLNLTAVSGAEEIFLDVSNGIKSSIYFLVVRRYTSSGPLTQLNSRVVEETIQLSSSSKHRARRLGLVIYSMYIQMQRLTFFAQV